MSNSLKGVYYMKKTIGVIFDECDILKLEDDAKRNGRLVSSHVRYIVQCYLNTIKEENQVKNNVDSSEDT